MFLWNYSPSRTFTALLVTLLIGTARSFPALERPDSSALPSEIETQEGTNVDKGTPPANATDDAAILKISAQQPIKVASGEEPLPQPLKLDYYDYLQLPNDPDDELPALPDHAVNVNEDYAGIYDYRGSQDGRFRRKRTLTTNVEQFLTRSSRIRAKRMAVENAYEENAAAAVSPAEQAENLVSLLSVMQDSDPEFDATEFLKVLDAPSVSEQDLEYLLLLSSMASQKEAPIPKEFLAIPTGYQLQPPAGHARNHKLKAERQPVYLTPNVFTDDILRDQGSWVETPEQERIPQRTDLPRMYAIASLLPARGPSAGIAM